MKKTLLFLVLLTIYPNLNAQIQISNFTYNNVQNSDPAKLQEFNGEILFSAGNDGSGKELWSSNGTSSNTNLVIDTNPGVSNGLNTFYSTILNNEFYFVTNDILNYSGGEIWKTDGTTSGSSLVTSYIGRIFGITTVGNNIYFTLKTNSSTLQIWKTDGTNLGTVLVKDNIGIMNAPSFQGSVNNTFIFTIETPSSSYCKVWRSDGTESGTYPITGEIDGNGSTGNTSDLSHYIKYNNKLYFITRYFLYETDGTTSGTHNIKSVWNAQNNLVSFGDVIELNGKMYFSFFSKNLKKLSIYKSDGTTSGTSEIYTKTSSQYFYPSYFNSSDDNLIFTSINSNNGTSLFYLNSITNLTSEVIEIDQNPQEPSFFLGPYTALSLDNLIEDIFFVSSPKQNVGQKKGWILNIATSTLNPIQALDNIFHKANGQKIVYNNDLYYSKNFQLWKYDTDALNINSLNGIEKIHFYPNPALDLIYFNTPNTISQIKIYDLNGKLVLEEDIFTNNSINIEGLNSGSYIIKIIGKNGSVMNKKLIKK